MNDRKRGLDPIEGSATGRCHTADDGEEPTNVLEDGEPFYEEPLEDGSEEDDRDELTNHLQRYLREAGTTPLLTAEGEKEVALRIEQARKELEDIGLSLPFAAQNLLNIFSRSKTVPDLGDEGKSDERVIATLEGLKQASDQSGEAGSLEQSDRYGAEMRRLVERIKRATKQYAEARNVLTKANLRLVVTIAKKYMNRGLSFPDLVQEGNVGLMKAAEKFDGRMGYRFATCAVWWIRQAITRAIGEQTRTIHIPAHMTERVQHVALVSRKLSLDLGREPFPDEIAREMGLSVKKIGEVLDITHEPISLETPTGGEGTHLADLLEDKSAAGPQDPVLLQELAEGVKKALSTLTVREEELIRKRFGIGETSQHTLEELAQRFGLTRERVRQIEAKALRKLRRHIGAWQA